MPHGNEYEHTFEQFKNRARAQGGEITDDLMEDFRAQLASHLSNVTTDQLVMMDQDADYI